MKSSDFQPEKIDPFDFLTPRTIWFVQSMAYAAVAELGLTDKETEDFIRGQLLTAVARVREQDLLDEVQRPLGTEGGEGL